MTLAAPAQMVADPETLGAVPGLAPRVERLLGDEEVVGDVIARLDTADARGPVYGLRRCYGVRRCWAV